MDQVHVVRHKVLVDGRRSGRWRASWAYRGPHRPGDLAEVDFFEVLADVDGTAARRGSS